MIFVDRKIFNGLNSDLKKRYIDERVGEYLSELEEKQFDKFELLNFNDISSAIFEIITNNEKIIEKYGLKSYFKEEYPAFDHEVGYRQIGRIIISPFDWSMGDENDEEFSYTFTLGISL